MSRQILKPRLQPAILPTYRTLLTAHTRLADSWHSCEIDITIEMAFSDAVLLTVIRQDGRALAAIENTTARVRERRGYCGGAKGGKEEEGGVQEGGVVHYIGGEGLGDL